MFSSKFIKGFCFAALIIMLIISMFLLMYSVGIHDKYTDTANLFFIVSIAIPIFTVIALYPLFALASIHENIKSIDENLSFFYRSASAYFNKSGLEDEKTDDVRCVRETSEGDRRYATNTAKPPKLSKEGLIDEIGNAPFKMR